jgi:DNA excision repair protein ERCC-4
VSKDDANEPIIFPAVIAVDNREQLPYAFLNIRSDAKEGRRPMVIRTARTTLKSGDYSIVGFEDRIACERKSAEDAFSTFGTGRARFERELERLNQLDYAAVVIEAEWSAIVNSPPERTQFLPKSFFRSVVAWTYRYPRVHWWAFPGRAFAEVATFRLLERFWREQELAEERKQKVVI